jgi:hypothetical protein
MTVVPVDRLLEKVNRFAAVIGDTDNAAKIPQLLRQDSLVHEIVLYHEYM